MKLRYLLLLALPFLSACMNVGSLDSDIQAILASREGRHVRPSVNYAYFKQPKRRLVAPPIQLEKDYGDSKLQLKNTREVRKYIRIYSGKGKRDIIEPWSRRSKHLPVIDEVLKYYRLPQELSNLAFIESKFNRKARSRVGATGLWQLMKPTARELGLKVSYLKDERKDVMRSTIAASRYLIELYERYDDWLLTIAAYNAGPGTVSRAIKRSGKADFFHLARRGFLPKETVNHVAKFIAVTMITRDPERYGLKVPTNILGDHPVG